MHLDQYASNRQIESLSLYYQSLLLASTVIFIDNLFHTLFMMLIKTPVELSVSTVRTLFTDAVISLELRHKN